MPSYGMCWNFCNMTIILSLIILLLINGNGLNIWNDYFVNFAGEAQLYLIVVCWETEF